MGQYFVGVFLPDIPTEEPGNFYANARQATPQAGCFKLTEHAYVDNTTVKNAMSFLIQHPCRVAWIGDECDSGAIADPNLAELHRHIVANDGRVAEIPANDGSSDFKGYLVDWTNKGYLVDWTKRRYLSIRSYLEQFRDNSDILAPLPLLTAIGNGCGGGDYLGTDMKYVGSWAWDLISVEGTIPDGFRKILPKFVCAG